MAIAMNDPVMWCPECGELEVSYVDGKPYFHSETGCHGIPINLIAERTQQQDSYLLFARCDKHWEVKQINHNEPHNGAECGACIAGIE